MIRARSRWARAAARGVIGALLAAATLAGAGGDALAHANFARSDPPPNAVLATPPSRLRVWFTEAFDPSKSALDVFDAARQRVAIGPATPDAQDPTLLSVPFALGPGVYTVAWRTVSAADGDQAQGFFAFVVGAATPPAEGQPTTFQTQAADDLQVGLGVSPGAVGANTLRVQVRDATGQTPADLQRVTARLRPPPPDLGLAELVAQPTGDAATLSPLVLGLSGDWQVEVRVRRAGRDDVATSFTMPVAAAAPAPPATAMTPTPAAPSTGPATAATSTPAVAAAPPAAAGPPATSTAAPPATAISAQTRAVDRASTPTAPARGLGSGRGLRAAALGVAALVALAATGLALWRRRRRR